MKANNIYIEIAKEILAQIKLGNTDAKNIFIAANNLLFTHTKYTHDNICEFNQVMKKYINNMCMTNISSYSMLGDIMPIDILLKMFIIEQNKEVK